MKRTCRILGILCLYLMWSICADCLSGAFCFCEYVVQDFLLKIVEGRWGKEFSGWYNKVLIQKFAFNEKIFFLNNFISKEKWKFEIIKLSTSSGFEKMKNKGSPFGPNKVLRRGTILKACTWLVPDVMQCRLSTPINTHVVSIQKNYLPKSQCW